MDTIANLQKMLQQMQSDNTSLRTILQQKEHQISRMEDILAQKMAHPEEENETSSESSSSSCETGSSCTASTSSSDTEKLKTENVKLRLKRQGVSAPAINRKSRQLAKRNSKLFLDPSTTSLIEKAMLNNEFLCMVDPQRIKLMSECISGPIVIKPPQRIINEGDTGDGLYILQSGTVDISKNNEHIRSISADINETAIILGELAILYNCTRTASVTASTECRLWYLDRESFQTISIESGNNTLNEYKNFLRKVSLLKKFPERKLVKLIDVMELEIFTTNHYIIRQNSVGNTFYLIVDGEVDITQESENGETVFIRKLKKGDYFGEKALLAGSQKPRTANCIAASDVECLCLEREDFLRLIGPIAEKQYGDSMRGASRFSTCSSIGDMAEEDTNRMSSASFVNCRLIRMLVFDIKLFEA